MQYGFGASLADFIQADDQAIVGQLIEFVQKAGFSRLWLKQPEAWASEIAILKDEAKKLCTAFSPARGWAIFFEYEIARRVRRIDGVLVGGNRIFVVEVKVGASNFDNAAKWQAREYALDLRDFHELSANRVIIPILIATEAGSSEGLGSAAIQEFARCRGVPLNTACLARTDLAEFVVKLVQTDPAEELKPIEPMAWAQAPYRPSLNIIEAAERIFSGHQVREISHACADNLTATSEAIVQLVRQAQQDKRRIACFVTGVPGAGKTLTGLNAVHDPELRRNGRPAAVFLSGNGPLVKIVVEALKRDLRRHGDRSKESSRQISTFIQNVHTFLNEYGLRDSSRQPPEHVVVFDEAQRAWDAGQMERKGRGVRSEPEMMLEVMERCRDWCALVAIVGSGQEIHAGEAGLTEWARALSARPVAWQVVASPHVMPENDAATSDTLNLTHAGAISVSRDHRLHLATTLRSFRATMVSEWVDHVLSGNDTLAARLLHGTAEFPLVLTRDLDAARRWLSARITQEDGRAGLCGLVASSGARRLRAYGLEVSAGFSRSYPFEDWFLTPRGDIRSSQQLEVAATEFECQGLELDWIGMCWGDDLTWNPITKRWDLRRFTGTSWKAVRDQTRRRYLLNKYRVLLTRARLGMVIWVPRGSDQDITRDPERLDATARFLAACGVAPIEGLT